MKPTLESLKAAAKAGIISDDQANKLSLFLSSYRADAPAFVLAHILYYLGGLIAISAITLFITNAWEGLRGGYLLSISVFLYMIGISLTHYFIRSNLRIPASLLAAFSLAVVPLAVYNIQVMLGYFPVSEHHLSYVDLHRLIDWRWIMMEFATLIAGVIMYYIYRLNFLLFPISVILWYMGMDLYPFLFSQNEPIWSHPTASANFSMAYGALLLFITVFLDLRNDEDANDPTFWLYIVGAVTFWGGLSCHPSANELSRFIYCMINVGLIFIAAFLDRRIFAVLGTMGILGYLFHLSDVVFKDSLSFPFVLILLGILVIFIGIFYTRIEHRLKQFMLPYMPAKIARRIK